MGPLTGWQNIMGARDHRRRYNSYVHYLVPGVYSTEMTSVASSGCSDVHREVLP
jgi:hypothetical protein